MKSVLKSCKEYAVCVLKWIFYSVIIGIVCGVAGSVFHHSVDAATHLRGIYPFILFLLPVAGLIIVFLYKICGMENDKGTNSIISAARSGEKIPLRLAPLILVGTTLTHLCGGSSGREGAALQIGGSIGSFFSGIFKTKDEDTHILIMCGMSALFSAVFGTPITAAVFSLEVVSVGVMHYGGLLPCVLSALVAKDIASRFNIHATHFTLAEIPQMDYTVLAKVVVISALAAILSIIFILTMHNAVKYSNKYIKNKYIRVATGGVVVVILTLLVGTNDYNGAGMEVITSALENGTAPFFAFALKLLFTAITLSTGFKGGEIVPTFFVGSTFGIFIAPLFGLNPSFVAAICLIALFCGVVNSPIASIILSIEIFGAEGLIYFAIAVAVSYIISGYYSLYSTQKFVYSKLQSVYIDRNAK
ncbi:MAG: chloride channel protein [Clostridia bacterium]